MSTNAQNGTAVVIKVGTQAILYGTTNSMKIGAASIDISNKDSAGWKEVIYGQRDWSMDGDFIFVEDSVYGFADLFDALNSKTDVSISWTSGITGSHKYSGTAIVSSIDMTAPMEAAQTFKVSFTGTGAIAKATI